MPKKKTHEEYVAEAQNINPNIEVVGEYIDSKTKILHRCLIHNIEWMVRPDNIIHGKGCPECAKENRIKNNRMAHEEYVEQLFTKNPAIKVIGKYVNARTPILHKCIIDNYEWMTTPDKTLRGRSCPKCAGNIKKTHEDYVCEMSLVNPNIEVIGQYIDAKTPILHKCLIDRNTWYVRPNDILMGKGCPLCAESKGEKAVRLWLDKHNILYVCQKTFKNCKNTRMLPFDFYLPEYNICIEYDGEQHFEPVDFANKGKEWANKQFDIRRKCDKIKTEYCENNNIKLFRIPYFKNAEEELNNFLFI